VERNSLGNRGSKSAKDKVAMIMSGKGVSSLGQAEKTRLVSSETKLYCKRFVAHSSINKILNQVKVFPSWVP